MEPVVQAVHKVARTSASVLLIGESGTGKEVAARLIHRLSDRVGGPFVAINCAAVPETLLETELFGHEKGAFTGAAARRRGRLELADGGTFFLDEIAEFKPELQAKLLRVLQERRFERVGDARPIESDVRWIAATNRDLRALMEEGRFREDLYYRLAVFPIRLPPLRERRQDILPIAQALVERIARQLGHAPPPIDDHTKALLAGAEWRGNIRELANALERALILSGGTALRSEDLGLETPRTPEPPRAITSLAELERAAIERALALAGGNRRVTAERLGIGLRTLYDKLKRYGLE
jgi:DNA-binding NtrC family response regulator